MVQPEISKADLTKLLRNRGVFCASDNKEMTVPILTMTTLSPDEVEGLLDGYRTKEDNPKTITRTIPWEDESKLMEHIPHGILDDFERELEFANYELATAADFVPVDGDDDHVKLEFKVERTDRSKSWTASKSVYPGTLEFKKVVDGDSVKIAITYTADETLDVARKATDRVIRHFKQHGQLQHSATAQRVTFSSFSNSQRVKFLLSLTAGLASPVLSFQDVNDVAICPDDSCDEFPEPLSWVEQRIRDFRCKGDALHEAAFLDDADCHDFIQLYLIDASFAFDIKGAVGSCQVCLSFPRFGSRKDASAELEIKVLKVKLKSGADGIKPKMLQRMIAEEFQDQMIKACTAARAGADETSGVSAN